MEEKRGSCWSLLSLPVFILVLYCVFASMGVLDELADIFGLLFSPAASLLSTTAKGVLALATVAIGYFWPVASQLMYSEAYHRPILSRVGTFGVLSGLVVGVVAPPYLEAQGWSAVYLVITGGALFFSVGVASLAASKWDNTGYAIAMPGFAATIHYTSLAFRSTVGAGPPLLKLGALLALCEGAYFLALTGPPPSGHRGIEGEAASKRAATLLAAILELVTFFNIIFELWSKFME